MVVRAVYKLAELKEPRRVVFPVEVIAPVKLALVVTFPAVRPEAVPVKLVATPLLGVPSAPPFVTNAPAVPTLIPRAVATPVPKEVIPVPPEETPRAVPSVSEAASTAPAEVTVN